MWTEGGEGLTDIRFVRGGGRAGDADAVLCVPGPRYCSLSHGTRADPLRYNIYWPDFADGGDSLRGRGGGYFVDHIFILYIYNVN